MVRSALGQKEGDKGVRKIKEWFRESLTIFVARVGMALTLVLTALQQLADVLNMPEVKVMLGPVLDPKVLSILGFTSFVVVELARRRTLPPAGE